MRIMKNGNYNLVSQVYDLLKNDILNGRYLPGGKLILSKLRENYQVGASPIREALSQLLAEGLVTTENMRGFRVSPVSLAQLKDIYEARACLERVLVELAIKRGDDVWEAGIVAAAHRLFKYGNISQLEEISIEEWEELHHEFHNAIVNGCGSSILLEVRQSLYEKATRYRNLWLKENVRQEDAFDSNISEHKDIVKAVLERDQEMAQKMIYEHILVPVKIIEESFQ
ncbi:DNA-binding transcriptional regulator CsiR [Pseudemcibacter aquimaris]|uniref:DNA-binding transcriptional regulator CsiR n=1 Tax=Pseudemcibacter aquimaris TaxID=2857064 RepID=UPI002011953C|nr:DNA-binding transcriptional regulator CsiR [Pseudemcibacter aquimaris]MCC3860555.1 DNA-binding transcriptional regulator CsiR [Pseudemcibacter aquimaris]WDU59378.1 DNA-binding transcriptional regulator CsiR [Pseudemcibacter aquimaris]